MESSSSQNPGDSKSLSRQFDSVLDKELETRKKYEEAILDLSASEEEVLSWWKSRDPLAETFGEKLRQTPSDKVENEFNKEARLFNYGAILLVVGVMCKHTDNQDVSKWYDEVQRKTACDAEELFIIAVKSLNELFTLLIKNLEMGYTFDDLEQLFFSAEMLTQGARFSTVHLDYSKQLGELVANTLVTVSTIKWIKEKSEFSEENLVSLDEVRILSLKACILQNAIVEDRSKLITITNEALIELLNDLSSLFVGTSEFNTMWKRLRQPSTKGFLHECVWYLDFVMLRHMYPEKYLKIHIIPAFSDANRPEIGKPEHNRAYDFFVTDERDIDVKKHLNFVQLKSSPQLEDKPGSDKKYHPRITVIEEQNFMDVNPARLRAKINAYKQILKNGFRQDDQEKLNKYILPTVKSYFEKMDQTQ
jgi:hypothetical protein